MKNSIYNPECYELKDRCLRLETLFSQIINLMQGVSRIEDYEHLKRESCKNGMEIHYIEIFKSYSKVANYVDEFDTDVSLLCNLISDMYQAFVGSSDSSYDVFTQEDNQRYYDKSHGMWEQILIRHILQKDLDDSDV